MARTQPSENSAERATLAAIAAVARNGVIGKDGDLPWRLREDLRRFKRLTMGGKLLMGRKTWDSIGRPLPGRESFVLTRGNPDLPDGVERLSNLEEVEELLAEGGPPCFCIGGAQVYALLLPLCDELLLTRVDAEVDGDVEFPTVKWNQWELFETEDTRADEHNEFDTRFQHYKRRD